MREYRAGELAVLAYVVTGKCKSRDKQYVIAQWGVDSDFDTVTIMLNTGGLDTSILMPASSGDKRYVQCGPTTGEMKRTAYDTECKLELFPDIAGDKIKVRRKNFENRLPDVKLPLLLP